MAQDQSSSTGDSHTTAPITREEMLEILRQSLCMGTGPFTTEKDQDRWEASLLSSAQTHWIDALLEIALNPPHDIESVQEGWDLELQFWVENIAVLYPRHALSKIAHLIQEDVSREEVIGSLLRMGSDEAPEWCKALITTADRLSGADLNQLIKVLKVTGNTQAENLLHQIESIC